MSGCQLTCQDREKSESVSFKLVLCSFLCDSIIANYETGILLPKLFRPTVRKNCSRDQEKLLKFEIT